MRYRLEEGRVSEGKHFGNHFRHIAFGNEKVLHHENPLEITDDLCFDATRPVKMALGIRIGTNRRGYQNGYRENKSEALVMFQ